ncbi:MAG TPA: flagellar hook-length control protein FliK [Tabrizicola sp.]
MIVSPGSEAAGEGAQGAVAAPEGDFLATFDDPALDPSDPGVADATAVMVAVAGLSSWRHHLETGMDRAGDQDQHLLVAAEGSAWGRVDLSGLPQDPTRAEAESSGGTVMGMPDVVPSTGIQGEDRVGTPNGGATALGLDARAAPQLADDAALADAVTPAPSPGKTTPGTPEERPADRPDRSFRGPSIPQVEMPMQAPSEPVDANGKGLPVAGMEKPGIAVAGRNLAAYPAVQSAAPLPGAPENIAEASPPKTRSGTAATAGGAAETPDVLPASAGAPVGPKADPTLMTPVPGMLSQTDLPGNLQAASAVLAAEDSLPTPAGSASATPSFGPLRGPADKAEAVEGSDPLKPRPATGFWEGLLVGLSAPAGSAVVGSLPMPSRIVARPDPKADGVPDSLATRLPLPADLPARPTILGQRATPEVTDLTGPGLTADESPEAAATPLFQMAGPVAASPGSPASPSQPFPTPHLAAQITGALSQSPDGATELALSPEELGHVRLRLERDAQHPDRMVVMITFERPETLDLFRRHASELTDALRAAGFSGADIGFGQQTTGGQGFAGQTGQAEADGHPTARSLSPVEGPAPDRQKPRLAAGASLDLRL